MKERETMEANTLRNSYGDLKAIIEGKGRTLDEILPDLIRIKEGISFASGGLREQLIAVRVEEMMGIKPAEIVEGFHSIMCLQIEKFEILLEELRLGEVDQPGGAV